MIERTRLPGTLLKYKKMNSIGLFSPMSKPVEVYDFSKSGIGFWGDDSIQDGDYIVMKVIFPDGKRLKLKGEIRWSKPNSSPDHIRYGVQFFAFGHGSRYNRPEALLVLRDKAGQHISFTTRTTENTEQEDMN